MDVVRALKPNPIGNFYQLNYLVIFGNLYDGRTVTNLHIREIKIKVH